MIFDKREHNVIVWRLTRTYYDGLMSK